MPIRKQPDFKRLNQLQEGDVEISFFVVESIDIRTKSDGEEFMAIRLKDRTGITDSRIWEDIDRYRELKAGDIVKVEVEVRTYKGKPSLNIQRMRLLQDRDFEEGFDVRWLQEWSEYDIDELWARLKQMVDRVEDEHIRHVVHSILGAKEEVLRKVPAAQSMHHPYFGGLLEHTVWLTDNCLRLLDNYQELNKDLVIAGAVLHDIGKTEELAGEFKVDYTAKGRLIGHIIQGRDLLRKHAGMVPDFPEDVLLHLEHIILAHQGEKEWGSPVVPSTPEAFFVHMMDNLDAKVRMFLYAMKNAPADREFSDYHRTLGRRIYLSRIGEEEEADEPAEE
ncbi:MAG: HD domain-containing protein [Planctomycetota bacterium]|jgi:3'-5' exoribonuclease|nr:HD domain-containing protein [Planctomycetota bacterium]